MKILRKSKLLNTLAGMCVLFPVAAEQIDVMIHPQSVIHSMVSYRDGSVLAQLGAPDMRTPIAYTLAWPERIDAPVARLNLAEIGQLTFANIFSTNALP